ncbi:hypothetical protein BDZ89DRAFT_1021349 [Hymenopellis radicata]|nr:hypothetical protein BDZ89DRAFT_1021349 [Hymenopellis radicata]
MKAAEVAARKASEQAAATAEQAKEARRVFQLITEGKEKGGFGFESMTQFMQSLFQREGSDSQFEANLTRFCRDHGDELARKVESRSPGVLNDFVSDKMAAVLAEEGRLIQEHLARKSTTSVTDLLSTFSVTKLAGLLPTLAPTLWRVLETVTGPEPISTNKTKKTGRERGLVFATICAMISILRSQRSNNFQTVIGLFLLGSGAAKRQIEVLSHAGLSTSYSAILEHVKTLSQEGILHFRQVVRDCMCSIVWDNLNIAFRVESQRLDNTNRFDNGTTATLIPLHDPFTGGKVPHGTLTADMKPPRETTKPPLNWTVEQTLISPEDAVKLDECSLWQLKKIALDVIAGLGHLKKGFRECPEVIKIALHTTEQYPLPAMHEDESSIDGTIRVYLAILKNLGITNEEIRAHGLMFTDGDLLTDSLVDKIESARRNSPEEIEGLKMVIRRFGLFHAKMAGCRMVVNEHWNKVGAPAGLWWENTRLLNRKPMVGGWQKQKATRWKPSHELLEISLAAHIKDAFRIHCGSDDLDEWAKNATEEEFDRVSQESFNNLFTTEAYDRVHDSVDSERDIIFENSILQNRDMLWYSLLVSSIKSGDIGRVILVLRMWMVMMRTPKTMPKYADAIFETLARVDSYHPKLKAYFLHNWLVNLTGRPGRFKEVDLLQEHQNFWAKIIYNAKGVNRSWDWLAMITVCIFSLRDAMRTVEKAYKIPSYGESHTVPSMTKEVELLATALATERIQEYTQNRLQNDNVNESRDLIYEGSKYANTRTAFQKFTPETRHAQNLGVVGPTGLAAEERDIESEDEEEDEYEVDEEDLAMDEDEAAAYEHAEELMAIVNEMSVD